MLRQSDQTDLAANEEVDEEGVNSAAEVAAVEEEDHTMDNRSFREETGEATDVSNTSSTEGYLHNLSNLNMIV